MSDFVPSEPIGQSDRPDSPIIDGQPAEVDPVPDGVPRAPAPTCVYAGLEYGPGAQVCVGSKRLQCFGGNWIPAGDC